MFVFWAHLLIVNWWYIQFEKITCTACYLTLQFLENVWVFLVAEVGSPPPLKAHWEQEAPPVPAPTSALWSAGEGLLPPLPIEQQKLPRCCASIPCTQNGCSPLIITPLVLNQHSSPHSDECRLFPVFHCARFCSWVLLWTHQEPVRDWKSH